MKLLPLVVIGLFGACSTKSAPPPPPSPTASPPTGQLEHHMANCPNAVPGAATRVTETADGVDLAITAVDSDTQLKIQALADAQTQMGDPSPVVLQHTGEHGGPGGIGHCPIVHDATLVTATRLDNGVTIHVKATDPARVKDLQRETTARVDALATVARRP